MQDHQPHTNTAREIRRLDQRADHLEFQGRYDEATELRKSAASLAEAEAQRLVALDDAQFQVARLTDRLRTLWQDIDPRDSFAWFIQHTDVQQVLELRIELDRQRARILVLEAAQA